MLTASYGAGHRQAARAIEEALRLRRPDLRVASADYVDLVHPLFNRLTQAAYVLSVKYVPAGFGWFYRATARIPPDSAFQRFLNGLGRQRVLQLVRRTDPRVVVCTFPTQAGVLSALRLRGEIDLPLVTVITDNTVHSQWIHPATDRYCVSAPEVAAGVVGRGVPPERVRVTGIPIRPAFRQRYDRAAVLRGLDLDPGRPTVLFMSGAFSMLRGVLGACRGLLELPQPPQVVLVTGRDRRLAAAARAQLQQRGLPVRVLGYVDEVAPLMQAADLLVSKAGGLTTSEALACGLPMIIFRPIPGQEEANTAFLVEHGAALAVPDARALAAAVRDLLADGSALAAMRSACRRLGRSDAADAVVDEVLSCMRAGAAEPVA
jgi:processive 1,2-diacylglycerol beta-glucosyltransferase